MSCLFVLFTEKYLSFEAPYQPQISEPNLNFIALGDWGKRGSYLQRSVAKQMGRYAKKYQSNFILTTGDNFYTDGVKSTEDPKWDNAFEDVYTAPSLMVPWYASLGNHDYSGNLQAQIDYSKISNRWNLPARYYFIDKQIDAQNSVRFIFLDTNPFILFYYTIKKFEQNLKNQEIGRQLKWLEKTLSESKAQWNIVIGHHPVYSAGPRYKKSEELIKHVKPILEKYSVQAYLCGHEHNLQHLNPHGTIDYLVSGTGCKTRETGKDEALFSQGICGFLGLTINKDQMRAEFIDYKGRLLYNAVINRIK